MPLAQRRTLPANHRRTGYVLVETLVSLVLLAGSAALLHLIALAVSTDLDHAITQDAAVRATDVVRNTWLREACAPSWSPGEAWPITPAQRLTQSVTVASDGLLRSLTVRTTWTASPFALRSRAVGRGTSSPIGEQQVSSAQRCD